MTDLFLGIIAVSVLVMAVIQVAAIVMAARAARQMGQAMARLEEDVRPLVANLRSVSADAARVSSVVAAQVERTDDLLNRLLMQVNELLQLVRDRWRRRRRGVFSLFELVRDFFRGRSGAGRADSRRRGASDEDDALFIG